MAGIVYGGDTQLSRPGQNRFQKENTKTFGTDVYATRQPTDACIVKSSGTWTGTHLPGGISRRQVTLQPACMYPLWDTTCILAHNFAIGTLPTSDHDP